MKLLGLKGRRLGQHIVQIKICFLMKNQLAWFGPIQGPNNKTKYEICWSINFNQICNYSIPSLIFGLQQEIKASRNKNICCCIITTIALFNVGTPLGFILGLLYHYTHFHFFTKLWEGITTIIAVNISMFWWYPSVCVLSDEPATTNCTLNISFFQMNLSFFCRSLQNLIFCILPI